MRRLCNSLKQIYLIILFLFFCTISKGEDPVNILSLSSYDKKLSDSLSLEKGLSKALKANIKRENIFFENMDSNLLDVKSSDFYENYLKEKYSTVKFDYIICWGSDAIELLTSHRNIFPNSKRVLIEGTEDFTKKDIFIESDLVIRTLENYSSTIEEMLRIKETKKIIVIGNSSKKGQGWINRLKKIISDDHKDIEIEYLIDKNVNEISKRLSTTSDDTVAFYLLMYSDGLGNKMNPYEVSEIICKDSNIPIFSFWEVLFGSGIVGGNLVDFETIGEQIAKIIFSNNNKNHENISLIKTIYDYNLLKKWGIDENKINPSSTIINKPPNFFILYKIQIFILILTLTFIMIISFLIYRHFLMKKTNKKSLELSKEIRRKNEQLKVLSELDSLTGLKNRRAIDNAIKIELDRNSRYGNPVSIVLIDIDFFKKINDTHGHHIGDQVLVKLSHLLKENARSTDSVSRWGGEEFLILAANTNLQDSVKFSEKIRRKIEGFNFIENEKITVSIGVGEYIPGEKFGELYERVDKALYSAKYKGRNTVEF